VEEETEDTEEETYEEEDEEVKTKEASEQLRMQMTGVTE